MIQTWTDTGNTMARTQWYMERSADGLTLARHWPPRFDVKGTGTLPVAPRRLSLRRLAHQIRQDLWRQLQGLRGFSPVVRLTQSDSVIAVCAGGRAARPIPSQTNAQIAALLADGPSRERWIRWAKQGMRP